MYELIDMELKYRSDLVSLFDKIKILRSLFEMGDQYYSKFGSILMEVASFFVNRKVDGRVVLDISPTVSGVVRMNFHFYLPLDEGNGNGYPSDYFNDLEVFVQNFNGKLFSDKEDQFLHLTLALGKFNSEMVLDDVSVNEIQDELRDAEFKQYATLSREDLLLDLKQRSSKLKEMTDYVELMERNSEQISKLNKELSEKNLELRSSMERVKQADRTKSQFLANMSHELRTPLNSIIGFSQLMLDGLVGEISDEQQEIVQDVLNSANHLLELINQILDISKIEAGMMEIKPKNIEIQDIVDTITSQVNPLLNSKNLDLELDLDPNIDHVYADETRLKQVLLNLMSNAIKFSPDGNKIIIKSKAENGYCQLSVKDFGVGISEEDQKAIFEEFKQADDSHTREYQGTGLGLSLCKKLVQLHGGQIWVESQIDQGSEFIFSLPMEGSA